MPRHIKREIIINCGIEEAFRNLITPSAIKRWWGASGATVIPENDGVYVVTWGLDEDKPDYVTASRISGIESPVRLLLTDFKYVSGNGRLPFEPDLDTEFILENSGGNTKLTVIQSGFPNDSIADEYYLGCVKGWNDTLESFKRTVESQN